MSQLMSLAFFTQNRIGVSAGKICNDSSEIAWKEASVLQSEPTNTKSNSVSARVDDESVRIAMAIGKYFIWCLRALVGIESS